MIDEKDVLQRVDSALRQHPHLRTAAIRTAKSGDRVILEGDVETFFEKQMAQEAVRYIDGIPQIDNQLVVRRRLPSSPHAVKPHPVASYPARVDAPAAY